MATSAHKTASSKLRLWLVGGAAALLGGCLCLLPCLGLGGYMLTTGRTNPVRAVQHLAVGNNDRTLEELTDHFRANGVVITKVSQPREFPGLLGTRVEVSTGDGFDFTLIKYDTNHRAQGDELRQLRESGHRDLAGYKLPVHINGSFVLEMFPSLGNYHQIVAVFQTF